jgi:two-component system, sensor histidine kinase RpfC
MNPVSPRGASFSNTLKRLVGRNLAPIEQPAVPSPPSKLIGGEADPLGELAQARIRFGMNIAFILLGLIAYRHDPAIGLAWVWATFSVCVISAMTLYVWARMLGNTLRDPNWRVAQRVASIVIDNLAVTWLLYFGGKALAGAYGVYLWITLGYGMRFGLSYLYGNLVASIIGYALVTQFSPFWKSNPSLSIGLGIALVVVPVYASFLIKRLRSAVADARLAYAAKSDFVANMSHELRTPLHGIISVADLLGRTDATAQQKEMFRIITVSSNTLLDLINRILDISKFEDRTFEIQREQMNLHAVINDTLTILGPQAQAKGLLLDFFIDSAVEPNVIGSPRQLLEILINLCGNAVKFTEVGSVHLNISSRQADDDQVGISFEVVDTGPGLAKEHLEKIFNPFYQADGSVTRKHGGTGLGTAIARELVRLMGGRITVDSELGSGTTFHIDLAFERQHAAVEAGNFYPLDVAVLASFENLEKIETTLAALGARSIRLPPSLVSGNAPLPTPPAIAFVDLNVIHESAVLIRASICSDAEQVLWPVCAVGPESARQRAIELGYNSFVPLSELLPGSARLLSMAAALRRDYSSPRVSKESEHRIKILVAEDNSTNQTIARLALAEGGFDCTIVADGEEALIELTDGSYAAAIIDMHMPTMDGMEVARLYNFAVTDPALRIPLIMITADSRPEVVADAELAGITRFLTKPLKPSVMIETINHVLKDKGHEASAIVIPRTSRARIRKMDVDSVLLDQEIVTELLGYMEGQERSLFFAEFSEDARSYVDSLEHTHSAQDFEKIRNNMHALCGAARTVGALRLAAYARRVEYMPTADITKSVAALQSELGELVAESELALRRMAELDQSA